MTTKEQEKASPPLSRPLALLCALSKLLTHYEQERKQAITLRHIIKHVIKPKEVLSAAQELHHLYRLHRASHHEHTAEGPQVSPPSPSPSPSPQASLAHGLEGLTICVHQLLMAKDVVERSPEIEQILGLDHTQDLFLYQLITKLSHKAYLLRLYESYKQACRDEERPLATDERSLLDLSLWLTHLATGEELRLVDPQPNDLWVPKSMDPLYPSRVKRVQRSLMPSLQTKTSIERRGLVVLQNPPTTP